MVAVTYNLSSYNPAQGIWNKLEKSSKIEQVRKKLISIVF